MKRVTDKFYKSQQGHILLGAGLAAVLLLGVGVASVVPGLTAKEVAGSSKTPSEATVEPSGRLAITVYKHPQCGCCGKWIDHLEANGFTVTTVNREDMAAIKAEYGVTSEVASCHTAMADGFVIEGHVPAEDIKSLLDQRPEVVGISVPGMPMGSPGMEAGGEKEPFQVLTFDAKGRTGVVAVH